MRLKNRTLNSESFSEFFNKIPIPTFAWHIVGEELVLIDFNNATEKLSFEGISLGIKASELFKDDKEILTNLFRCLSEKSNFSEDLEVRMKTTDDLKIFSTTYTFLLPDLVIFHVEDITIQKQVRKALQEARDVLTGLELIINQSPAVVILIRNEEGWPVEYITDNIRQFGYEPSDFYSHILQFADLIHPDDLKDAITEAYLKCQNGTNEFVQEYRIISKLGAHRWINIRTWVKRDRDNNITHFQGIILDITERRQTEEKLKESEEKFRKITEHSLLGVAIFQEGKIKYVNKALADLAEYSPIEIKEWPLNEFVKLVHPEDLPTVIQRMQEKLEDNKDVVSRYIFRILTKSGKIKWLEIISKVIIYQGSLAILATMIDITEKKRAEIKLQESEENLKKLNEVLEQKVSERTRDLKKSEEKYRFLYNETPIGIGTATKDGKVIAMNKTMEEMVGYGIKELSEMGLSSLYVNPNRREQLLSILQKESRVQDFEARLKRKYGTEFLALMDTAIIDLEGEKIIQTTVRDITERKNVEQKLRESEANLITAIENLPFAFFMVDKSGRYIMQNTTAKKIWGDLIGKKTKDIAKDEETLILWLNNNSRVFSGETIASEAEYVINGELRYFYDIIAPVYVGNKIQNILGVNIDITERKKTEQKLKESEKKYKEIIESIEEGYYEVDLKGNYVDINDYHSRYFGYSRDEMIGSNYRLFLLEEEANKIFKEFNEVFKNNLKNGHFEITVIRNDGEERYNEGSVYLKYDMKGKKIGFYGFTRDITERKITENKLKDSEEKYRSVFEQAADSIILIDIQTGDIVDFNSQMNKTLGYTRDEFKNLKIPDFDLMEKADEYIIHIEKIIREGSDIFETRYLTKSSEILDILVNANLIKISGKDYLQSILRDITDQKKVERKLKESELKYKEAYKKAEFYKDIFTHDINNILSNIKTSIELSAIYLKDPNRIPDVEKLYEVIRGQFKKGSSLVSNIRKLSQIEDSVSLVKPVDINDVLKKEIGFTLKSYQVRDVKIRTHDFERGILVNANDLLIDLFNNLFNNSIKYNDSRVVEIDVKMSREKKNNTNYIKLEFLDNGIGIPDKRKETLFEKEYVKDISSKGLGIGLTLVKKIVESYRGEIWVEDRIKGDYRQGTNFIVLIPEAL